MSLNINVERVADHEGLFVESPEGGAPMLGVVTVQLAEAMWHAHIGRITPANKNEVFRRVKIAEEINGPYLHNGTDDAFFTMEDVERRIGMRINVATLAKDAFEKAVAYSRAAKEAGK